MDVACYEMLATNQEPVDRCAGCGLTYAVATILGMERLTEAGRQIVAFVIDAQGEIQGYQTKNQLDPTEDQGHRHLLT